MAVGLKYNFQKLRSATVSFAETVTLSRLQFFSPPLKIVAHVLKHSCIQLPAQELKLFSRKATKSSPRTEQLTVLESFQIISYMFAFSLSVRKREGKKGAVKMPKQHTDSLLGIQDTLLRYY